MPLPSWLPLHMMPFLILTRRIVLRHLVHLRDYSLQSVRMLEKSHLRPTKPSWELMLLIAVQSLDILGINPRNTMNNQQKSRHQLQERLDRILSIENGEWYPGADRYTRRDAFKELRGDVDAGIPLNRVAKALKKMKRDPEFSRLRELNGVAYRYDHTPLEGEPNYHCFLGLRCGSYRGVFYQNPSIVAPFQITTLSSNMETCYDTLLRLSKQKRKVLLTRAPKLISDCKPFPNHTLKALESRFREDSNTCGLQNPFDYQP